MDSFKETQRQIQIALVVMLLVIIIGVVGFMAIENLSFLDAIWLTVITLATIGYGDIYARSDAGHIFTIFLIIIGIGTVAYGLQATATFVLSPAIRDLRHRRRIQRAIDELHQHYIVCGSGELVDKTITYVMESAKQRLAYQLEAIYHPLDSLLDRWLGDDAHGHHPRLRSVLRGLFLFLARLFHRAETLLDVVVVVTPDIAFAEHLRASDLLVVQGDPTSDQVLRRAGIEHARALVVMLDSDTENLLVVLTARAINANVNITTAIQDEVLAPKVIRVGANEVIAPYEVAGQFLNNATLRPAVNSFFNTILYSQKTAIQTTQLNLWEDSSWIGQRLGKLKLRERFEAGVIGLRREDGSYCYVPGDSHQLQENEVLLVTAPAHRINALQQDCYEGTSPKPRTLNWQRLPLPPPTPHPPQHIYALAEAETAVADMSKHYIICGSGRIAQNAIDHLDPERPFVIISDDTAYTENLLARGFRVIAGSPTQEAVLRRAGIERALAIMVAVEEPAVSVLTVINCRALSKHLLITAAASTDDMVNKLHRAGADRVVSPLQIAAQSVLLAATRPAVSDFLQYIVFNHHAGIETTELYMQDDSPWIGQTIESLRMQDQYRAAVIGIRSADGSFVYAPSGSYILAEHEVLIVVTPMEYSDELRLLAHGSATKRPHTLRHRFVEKKR